MPSLKLGPAELGLPIAFAVGAALLRLQFQNVETRYQIFLWWLAAYVVEVALSRAGHERPPALACAICATVSVLFVKVVVEGHRALPG